MRLIFTVVYQYQNDKSVVHMSSTRVFSVTSLSFESQCICLCACLSLHVWVDTPRLHVCVTHSCMQLIHFVLAFKYLLDCTAFQLDLFQHAVDISFIKHSLGCSLPVTMAYGCKVGASSGHSVIPLAKRNNPFQFSFNSNVKTECYSLNNMNGCQQPNQTWTHNHTWKMCSIS